MMRRGRILVGIAALAWGSVASGQQYHLVDLGTLGGNSSYAFGLNDHGEVVGYSYLAGSNARAAFMWTQGSGMIHMPGFQSDGEDTAYDINNSGLAVGVAKNGPDDPSPSAAQWNHGAPASQIPFPTVASYAYDINNSGHKIGTYFSPLVQAAFVVGNQTWTMPLAQGQSASRAWALNDQDVAVGDRYNSGSDPAEAVLWRPFFGVTSLGSLGGSSSGRAINEKEQVTGYSGLGGQNDLDHAFFWSEGTGMVSIHTLLDRESSWGFGISDSGAVVGMAFNGSFEDGEGFLWTAETGMRDLTSLLDVESAGWSVTTARDINDLGQIVGQAYHPRYGYHAVLLNPVPEPGTMVALGLGAAAFLRRRRR